MTEKPVKESVSVAVFGPDRAEVLAVLRPPDDEDLPDVWGLPAASLRSGEEPEDGVYRTGREKLGVELASPTLLQVGEAEREEYRLRMSLYEAEIREGRPSPRDDVEGVTRYVACAWAPPSRLRDAARQGSLCSRLCLRELGLEV